MSGMCYIIVLALFIACQMLGHGDPIVMLYKCVVKGLHLILKTPF